MAKMRLVAGASLCLFSSAFIAHAGLVCHTSNINPGNCYVTVLDSSPLAARARAMQ